MTLVPVIKHCVAMWILIDIMAAMLILGVVTLGARPGPPSTPLHTWQIASGDSRSIQRDRRIYRDCQRAFVVYVIASLGAGQIETTEA